MFVAAHSAGLDEFYGCRLVVAVRISHPGGCTDDELILFSNYSFSLPFEWLAMEFYVPTDGLSLQ